MKTTRVDFETIKSYLDKNASVGEYHSRSAIFEEIGETKNSIFKAIIYKKGNKIFVFSGGEKPIYHLTPGGKALEGEFEFYGVQLIPKKQC